MEARRSAVDCLVDEGRAREIDGHVTRAGRTGAVGRDAPGSPQRRGRAVSKQAKEMEKGRKSTVFNGFQLFSAVFKRNKTSKPVKCLTLPESRPPSAPL